MPDWFVPLSPKTHKRGIIGFDIEGCGGPGGFICGVISSDYTYNFFTDPREMFLTLLDYGINGFWLFAHNLEYDLPILAGPEFWEGSLLFSKSGLLWAHYKHKGRRARLLDSGNLFPRWSVATLGDMIGLPKLEPGDKINEGLAIGRPWEEWTLEDQKAIERYCARDAEIVQKAVVILQDLVLGFGGQLSPTIAGASMDIYRRGFHKWPWRSLKEHTNNLARSGFYGGRVENFAVGKIPGVNMYDVTSLYPYVQSEIKFPHPNRLKLEIRPSPAGTWWEWEGVAKVVIEMPDRFIPFLPYRHEGRLFFPHGRLEGVWTLLELREAIARGAKLKRVDWVLGNSTTFNPFTEFIERLFQARLGYLVSDDPRANLVKLILNSLYGRFGLNPEGGLFQLAPITPETDFKAIEGFFTQDIGEYTVAIGPAENIGYPAYINTLFAAQIASAARLVLLQALESQGDKAVYCDTDSIITRGKIETGEGLGSWRIEMDNGVADLLGPKEYLLIDRVLGEKAVVKGIPDRVAREYIKTGMARFARALTVREAVARGKDPSIWVEVYKSKSDIFPKRYILSPGNFRFGYSSPTRA